MVRIASFNVENLFARPKAFNTQNWAYGRQALNTFRQVNDLLSKSVYTASNKQQIRDLFVALDIYCINDEGAIRRKYSRNPQWAWFRKNRGKFDREPKDKTQHVEIVANGRGDWIGWVELSKELTNEVSTRMTARVIKDVDADIIGVVEAEDRPSLVRLNDEMLGNHYAHVMLIDGNDTRGIDVGIMTKDGFEIEAIKSNVDNVDAKGQIFSRDCPQYKICTPSGTVVHVLVNHFKSQSGGGGPKRQRQSAEVRRIVNDLASQNQHVVVLGDFNEGKAQNANHAPNLAYLYNNNSPLLECYTLQGFQTGNKPGTYNSCGWRNRLDYIFISKSLEPHFDSGGIFRKGLWGTRKTRPDKWVTYQSMANSSEQASDHAAVYIDLNL